MVTRSLVSYDSMNASASASVLLNGHQIIGELRPGYTAEEIVEVIEWSPDHW